MRRRSAAWITAVALGLLGASNIAAAQPTTKVYRVGWLATGGPPTGADRSVMEFQQGLCDLRYVIDKNITINGPGADQLAVTRSGGFTVFHVLEGHFVTIKGLTIDGRL